MKSYKNISKALKLSFEPFALKKKKKKKKLIGALEKYLLKILSHLVTFYRNPTHLYIVSVFLSKVNLITKISCGYPG